MIKAIFQYFLILCIKTGSSKLRREWSNDSVINIQVMWLVWLPASDYMFKVNNRNTRTRCEICSKFPIQTPEWRHWCCSGVFIDNFGCTPALSSVLSVWISGFHLCTQICSFLRFSPAFVVFPLYFPIGLFSCVFSLRMLLGHMGCTPFCRRQFFI